MNADFESLPATLQGFSGNPADIRRMVVSAVGKIVEHGLRRPTSKTGRVVAALADGIRVRHPQASPALVAQLATDCLSDQLLQRLNAGQPAATEAFSPDQTRT